MRLLVDTSALVALGDRGEAVHERALACRKAEARGRLHLTDYVLDETLTLLRRRGARRAAGVLADAARGGQGFELVFLGPDLFWKAEERFRKLADLGVSFTDCTSFVVMEHLRLDGAFAFDEHFAQAGYRVVPAGG